MKRKTSNLVPFPRHAFNLFVGKTVKIELSRGANMHAVGEVQAVTGKLLLIQSGGNFAHHFVEDAGPPLSTVIIPAWRVVSIRTSDPIQLPTEPAKDELSAEAPQ